MKRSYIEGPYGQIHIHQWGESLAEPALLCLSPSPFSGIAYNTIAPHLVKSRRVIAIDYPGYGNSEPTPHEAEIKDYAEVIVHAARAVSPDAAVDLMGFHTGCLVAVEAALRDAAAVNRLVLVDVPYFDPEKQAQLFEKMGGQVKITADISMLQGAWDFCVAKRLEHIPPARAYEMFVDHISSGEHTNAAFRAAFQYPCAERFAQTKHPSYVIATKAGLFEQSCQAAQIIPGSKLIELTQIEIAVLEKSAIEVAAIINQQLSIE